MSGTASRAPIDFSRDDWTVHFSDMRVFRPGGRKWRLGRLQLNAWRQGWTDPLAWRDLPRNQVVEPLLFRFASPGSVLPSAWRHRNRVGR